MIEIHDNEKRAWSQWLNCKVEDFSKKGLVCYSNPRLNDINQIYILALKHSFIISMPSEKIERYRDKLKGLNDISLVSMTDVINLFWTDIEAVRPILYQSFATSLTINICGQDPAVLLPAAEMKLLEDLKKACPVDEWSQSGLPENDFKDIFVVYKNNKIVAAAHYTSCPGSLASIGILTHPQHRGNGYGVSAVSEAAKNAMDKGLLVHYQTKIENLSSIALANKLGCKQFGYSTTLEMK